MLISANNPRAWLGLLATSFAAACSGSQAPNGGAGGAPLTASGGGLATGGVQASGGVSGNSMGGVNGTGGSSLSSTAGGSVATGGATAGGTLSAGANSATGGSVSTGGIKAIGGTPSTGGKSAAGGTAPTGGSNAAGGAATGGISSSGGSASTVTCVVGNACPTLGATCKNSAGFTCTCVGPTGSSFLTCDSPGTGGTTSTGGASANGGKSSSAGGAVATGGTTSAGGVGGTNTTTCGGAAPWTTGTGQVQLTVDASKKGSAWSRYYETGVAADHANTVLLTAWGRNIQNALKKGHDEAGFQYARFHGILDSDIGVYTEDASGNPVYVWTRFDAVYDALVAAGMRPILEISFMPPPLASDPTATFQWYNGAPANKSPPKDWTKWKNFMTALVQHLETRYGAAEVRNNWYFEIWNESSWMYSLGEAGYPALYNNTVTGLLAGDPQIKVGGPAASAASSLEQIPTLVSYTKSNNLKLDFVSWHRYANDDTQTDYADANAMLTYFEKLSGVIAGTGFKGISLNDEWGGCYDANVSRDSEVSASFIAKTVHLLGTDAKYPPPFMFGYWTISDLYEEINTGTNTAYREGNFGLLLKGDSRYPVSFDVAKPAFNAFRLLHMLGDTALTTTGGTTSDGVNVAATISNDNSAVQILIYNHVNGGAGNSASPSMVQLTVNNLPFTAANISVKHYMVDRTHSNSYQSWVSLGKPAQPSQTQWTQLSQAAELCYYSTTASSNSWTVTYPQNVYGVSLIVLSE